MFKLKDVTPVTEPFPVDCCNANVELERVELVTDSSNGGPYIDFFYTKDNRYSLRDRRFPVRTENLSMFQKEGETLAQTKERLENDMWRVLLHIASRILPEEELDKIEGDNFVDVAKKLVNALNAHCKGVMLYAKTTLNKNKFVAMPKAGRFLQRMDEGPCTLSYTPKELKDIEKYGSAAPVEGVAEVSDTAV